MRNLSYENELGLGLLVFALFTNNFFQQVSTYNEETKIKKKPQLHRQRKGKCAQ